MNFAGLEISGVQLATLAQFAGVKSDALTAAQLHTITSAMKLPVSEEGIETLLAKFRQYGDSDLVTVLSNPERQAEIKQIVEQELNPETSGPQVTRCPFCNRNHEV